MAKAAFLDRDGIVNIDKGYVHLPRDFEWNQGIFTLLKALHERDFMLLLCTNQSGIGRGFYDFRTFCKLCLFMQQTLQEKLGFCFDKIYFCPHAPEFGCACRKPKPGMIERACVDFPQLCLRDSILVGDNYTDILAARAAGVGRKFLLGKAIGLLWDDERTIENLESILCVL
ncbi:MAG: D-glycero-beta-D-manno-heptose 1,7-bisphosphate 7-phosphatase [Helicobacter sp.]|nr:D-glycero-beta-D-manno-heptose 1,7-bisphosphate 7-phosphatase [Helicobacter sp.]